MSRSLCCLVIVASLLCVCSSANAVDDHAAPSKVNSGPSPGHSMHGESFNEGPRQAAYLMPGMSNVHFPISSKHPLAQRFFDQGITQLHGFWYFEAERSFRQAAAFDADHPMPYWGMARANIENEKRSQGFIEQAMQRVERASEKERRLIEAWNARVKKPLDQAAETDASAPAKSDDERKKEKEARLKKYLSDLDSIAVDYPDDIEIKAMIVLQAWQNNGEGIEIQSFSSMNSLLAQIFQANPRHPAHHFRIHLWDYKKEELALQSAALCGPSASGIAHMWHMPGHTYSRVKRFSDAAWQQEASARVDHAHMMRDRVMPDQIHNYAHNNEWLIRSLMLIGQPTRAISLAKNMIELPRHPKYNTFDNRGSTFYGRERLLQVLVQYERWSELLNVTDTHYLPEDSDFHRNDERLAWRAISAGYSGKAEVAQDSKTKLESSLKDLEAEEGKKIELIDQLKKAAATSQAATSEPSPSNPTSDLNSAEASTPEAAKAAPETVPPASTEPAQPPTAIELFGKSDDPALPKELPKDWKSPDGDEAKNWSDDRKNAERELHSLRYRKQRLSFWLSALESHQAAAKGDFREALRHSHKARAVVSEWTRLEWLAQGGEPSEAWKIAEGKINDSPGEVLPLARGAWMLSLQPDKADKLQEVLEKLKPLATKSEQGIGVLDRLKSVLVEKGIVVDWTSPTKEPSDIGERPDLDTLGPFRWAPSNAPMWHAVNSERKLVTSKQYAGKPYIAILYLGSGCLHCVEQLTQISPRIHDFKNLGIELVAISTEDVDQLRTGIANFDKPIDTPLLSNVEQDTFKGFRAYDDFEGQPLHGTFLVDSHGRVLWQDIGHEPFMEIEFLLRESERLLRIGNGGNSQ